MGEMYNECRDSCVQMDTPDTDNLTIGDQFRLVSETILTVVGAVPASEAPESAGEGALYEMESTEPGDPEDERYTMLYRSYHLDRALAAGAEYLGKTEVEDPTEPFWCDSCEKHACGDDQYDEKRVRSHKQDTSWLDVTVCSYRCWSDLAAEQRRKRWQANY